MTTLELARAANPPKVAHHTYSDPYHHDHYDIVFDKPSLEAFRKLVEAEKDFRIANLEGLNELNDKLIANLEKQVADLRSLNSMMSSEIHTPNMEY